MRRNGGSRRRYRPHWPVCHSGRLWRRGVPVTSQLQVIGTDKILGPRGGLKKPVFRLFPKAVCTSVNNCVCHGIPDSRRLESGDIVNVDVTVFLDQHHGDCSATFLVGDVDQDGVRLVQAARDCLAEGIRHCGPGKHFNGKCDCSALAWKCPEIIMQDFRYWSSNWKIGQTEGVRSGPSLHWPRYRRILSRTSWHIPLSVNNVLGHFYLSPVPTYALLYLFKNYNFKKYQSGDRWPTTRAQFWIFLFFISWEPALWSLHSQERVKLLLRSKKNIAISPINIKHWLFSLDIKTKLARHVPRIAFQHFNNISWFPAGVNIWTFFLTYYSSLRHVRFTGWGPPSTPSLNHPVLGDISAFWGHLLEKKV